MSPASTLTTSNPSAPTPPQKHITKYLESFSALNRLLSSSPQNKPPARQLAMTLVHQILQGGAQNAGKESKEGLEHLDDEASENGTDTASEMPSENDAHVAWVHLKRTCQDILHIVKRQMKEANTAKRRNMLWILVALAVVLHMREVYGAAKEGAITHRAPQKMLVDGTFADVSATSSPSKASTAQLPTTLSNLSSHIASASPPDHDYSHEMSQIIQFLSHMFADRDAKVRFAACEAMYNICNIFRERILHYFVHIFDGTCRLAGDTDHTVRNANVLLTRLLKDIVAEDYNFNVEEFIPLIKDIIHSTNPYNRQFLLEWILLLNAVPDIQLIAYLPSFLSGVFEMCADQNQQIVLQAQSALEQFLSDLHRLHQIEVMKEKNAQERALESGEQLSLPPLRIDEYHPTDGDFSALTLSDINFDALMDIVIGHCTSHSQLVKLTALQWVKHLLVVGHQRILARYNARILRAILPSISHKEEKIRRAAFDANQQLRILIHYTAKTEDIQLDDLMELIQFELGVNAIPSRVCALEWIRVLLDKNFEGVVAYIDDLFAKLLRALKDSSQEVVQLVIDVLASLASTNQHFSTLVFHLLDQFCTDKKLMSKAGYLIRQLSGMLDTEKLFREISLVLRRGPFGEERREFCSLMVQTLNMILLTSDELSQVRNFIRGRSNTSKGSSGDLPSQEVMANTATAQEDLFTTLYKTWSYNPISTLCLCLLAKKYRHASLLVQSFSQMEMTVNFLVHIDNLVQLLESPIFVELRMQLLEPHRHPYLLKTLYGILMLLPQSSAYDNLNKRLQSISAMYFVAQSTRAVLDAGTGASAGVDPQRLDTENQEYQELLHHFQMLHTNAHDTGSNPGDELYSLRG